VEAAEVARRAAARVPEEHEDMRLALEAFELETLFFGAGEPAAMPRLDEQRPPPPDAGVGAKMIAAVVALLWATSGARPAEDCAELALAALAGGQLLETDTPLLGLVAILTLVLADRDEADAAWDEALAIAHRQGSLFSLSGINLWRGFTLHRRGELAEAEDLLRNALDESNLYGGAIPVQASNAFLAATLLERGDTAGAGLVLEPDVYAADGSYAARAWLISRLQLLVAEGHAEDALQTADELERTLCWIVNPAAGPWRLFKAQALDLLERHDEALELAEAELELARRFGAPDTVGIALRVLGTLEREAGLDHLREAADVLAESSARLEHAKTLAALGGTLRRSGSRSEAREPLREALDLAERCGARALAERARDELSATGARPRRTPRHGIDALTASELRIARLAADGRSNREIAQALFVTIRTVEMHLTHAYQKLEIASRKQLAHALGTEGDQARTRLGAAP
jgi:DNA-binding CsgD family transcriptional regulator